MASNTNKTKLAAFRKALEDNGGMPLDDAEVTAILGAGVDSKPYYAAAEREETIATTVVVAEKPAPKPAEAKFDRKVTLRNPDGTSVTLDVLKVTDKAVLVQVPVPKDLVVVRLKGEDVELDLVKLRELPGNQVHPDYLLPVATLIGIAEAARA